MSKQTKKPRDKAPNDVELGPHDFFLTHRSLLGLGLLSLLLQSLIFEPIGFWPLAFVCMVPWLLLIGGAHIAPRVYFHSYVLGLAFFLINMRWLETATGWGYLALSVYLGVYYPLVAIAVRHAVRRRCWPLAIVFPLVWTGSEMLRAVVVSGFPWFFLSHSLHAVLTMIQVSDLVGAYGVSFVVAAVNGLLADVILAHLHHRRATGSGFRFAEVRVSVVFALVLVLFDVVYGAIQLQRDTSMVGPKVAIVQGDFLDSAFHIDKKDHDQFDSAQRMKTYLAMIDEVAKQSPDLILLPESPWGMLLNAEVRAMYRSSYVAFQKFRERAMKYHTYIVTGSGSQVLTPDDIMTKERRYNSATIFNPEGTEPERYDKVHIVYFGEAVPFRFGKMRFLYLWMNSFMPWSGPDGKFEYSIFPGTEFRRFQMKARSLDDAPFRFSIPICYEDVMPYVSREFTAGGSDQKQIDFLLNISNDGWFGRGIQQPQHLAICVFRAVENRVGVARSVNTGGSAYIEPSGRVTRRVKGDPNDQWPGNCNIAVENLKVDSRFTLYSRYGDWFAWGCAVLWLVIFVDYWIARAREAAAHAT